MANICERQKCVRAGKKDGWFCDGVKEQWDLPLLENSLRTERVLKSTA